MSNNITCSVCQETSDDDCIQFDGFNEPANDSCQTTSIDETQNDDLPSSEDSNLSGEAEGLPVDSNTSELEISLKFHDYSGHMPVISQFRHQSEQIEPEVTSMYTQTEITGMCKVSVAAVQTLSCEKGCFGGIQVDRPTLTFEDISSNDSKVLFYTGIPDSGRFIALFKELESGMAKQTENGRPRSLRLIDEFFMVLMRLRLGLLIEDLSDRFRIGTSTCSCIFNRWIDYLDTQLHLHTHVEREMERVKSFRILQTVQSTMASQASKIWKICECLTNLKSPLGLRD